MANGREDNELSWSTLLDSDDAAYLRQFLVSGINLFLEKLAVSSLIASGETPQNQRNVYENFQQITADIVKPIVSLFGSEVSIPINAGLTLIAYATYGIKKKLNKEKAKRIVDTFVSNDNASSVIFAMVICDICRMFEHQIILLGKTGSNRNIKLLARTIVKRALNYITETGNTDSLNHVKKNSSTFTEDMARYLIFGVFRGISKKSSKYLDLKAEYGNIKFTCGDIIDQLGVSVGDMRNSATVYYFSDQFDRYIKYLGYRRSSILLNPEHMTDRNCSYLPLKVYKLTERHNLASSSLRHMNYGSEITALKDVEELRLYAVQVLRCVLCEDHCYYVEESLKSLRTIAAGLATRDDLNKAVDVVIDQIQQLNNKNELSQLMNIIQAEFVSVHELFRGAKENSRKLESIVNHLNGMVETLSYLAMENRKTIENKLSLLKNHEIEKFIEGIPITKI